LNRKIRIVLIAPLPPPIGGIATWTKNLLEYFEIEGRLDQKFELVHVSNARKFGSITERRKFARILAGVLNGTLFLFRFLKNIRLNRHQLLHITSSGSMALFRDILVASLFSFFGGRVLVHLRFGRVPTLMTEKNIEGIMLRILLRLANSVVCIDKLTLETLKQHYGKKVFYLPNPVSELFLNESQIVRNYADKSKAMTVLFVGHVIKAKGIFDLVHVVGQLDNIHLRIIGPYQKKELVELQTIAEVYPKLKYSVIGNLSPSEVFFELQKCTLFCLPSYTEGFPNAVLEAMAATTPMVLSTVGEIPEMVDVDGKPAAWLFPPGDKIQLKNALFNALRDSLEREKRAKLAKQKLMNSYTNKKIFGELQRIWLKTSQLAK